MVMRRCTHASNASAAKLRCSDSATLKKLHRPFNRRSNVCITLLDSIQAIFNTNVFYLDIRALSKCYITKGNISNNRIHSFYFISSIFRHFVPSDAIEKNLKRASPRIIFYIRHIFVLAQK